MMQAKTPTSAKARNKNECHWNCIRQRVAIQDNKVPNGEDSAAELLGASELFAWPVANA